MSGEKQGPNPKRKVVPVLGAAGLSLSLAGGASAATGGPAAEMVTRDTGVSHEMALREEQVSDVSLATFYVFDKENAGPSRHSERLACGCWTGTFTRQEMMLIRPRFVRSRSRTGTCRSTFREARGKHDQAQPPTQH